MWLDQSQTETAGLTSQLKRELSFVRKRNFTTGIKEGGRIFGMKPRGIIASTSAMAILNLSGFVRLQWSDGGEVAAALFFILGGYIVLWYYWQGKNWARIVVLLTSALAIFNVSTIMRPYGSSVLYNSLIVAEAVLGVFLLYWLNTKAVRNWFSRGRTAEEEATANTDPSLAKNRHL
jgi:hypothetical protein